MRRRRSRSKAPSRPALGAARFVALCVAIVAFLFAPLRTMSAAPAGDGSPPALKMIPDDDVQVLVEEHGAVVRIPALRPSRSASRASAPALTLAPPAIVALSSAAVSFTLEAPRCIPPGVAQARTHAELMVFLI